MTQVAVIVLAAAAGFVAWRAVIAITTPPPPDPPGAQQICDTFGCKAPGGPAAALPPVSLYFDGSQSMQGFVTDPYSAYGRVVRSVYQSVMTAAYPLTAYKFAGTYEPLGNAPANMLVSPAFYSGTDTRLGQLLERIAAAEVANKQICAIFSDFIQSDRTQDQTAVVNALHRVTASHPEVLLLAFRSSFSGLIYTETEPKGKIFVSVNEDRKQGLGRPFFLLVIAPGAQSLQQFRKFALSGLGEWESFQPTLPALNIQKKTLQPGGWEKFSKLQMLPCGASLEALTPADNSSGSMPPVEFGLTAETNLPLKSLAGVTHEIEVATFAHGKPQGAPRPVSGVSAQVQNAGAVPKTTGSRISLRYEFPRTAPRSWDAYRVRIRPGRGNLAVPAWVPGWTTVSDQNPDDANRTLHLNLLVEALVRAITENVPIADQFILLGRGE